MKLKFSRQIFEKKKFKYQISTKSAQSEPTFFMRADGLTDMTKVIAVFAILRTQLEISEAENQTPAFQPVVLWLY